MGFNGGGGVYYAPFVKKTVLLPFVKSYVVFFVFLFLASFQPATPRLSAVELRCRASYFAQRAKM